MEAVASQRYGRLLGSLEAIVESPALLPEASERARACFPTILARDARRVRRAAKAAHRAAPGPARDVALHEVRKKVKRLRYSAESATPVLGKRAKTLAKRAKSLQDALGAHQDTVASRAWLEDLAGRADGEVAVAFGAGRLHAREEQRARSAERELREGAATAPAEARRHLAPRPGRLNPQASRCLPAAFRDRAVQDVSRPSLHQQLEEVVHGRSRLDLAAGLFHGGEYVLIGEHVVLPPTTPEADYRLRIFTPVRQLANGTRVERVLGL